jgi:hypothetical protein
MDTYRPVFTKRSVPQPEFDRQAANSRRLLLESGRYTSISEMAAAEKIDRGYLGRILLLTLLAPDIVEAILDGTQPAGLGLPRLMEPFPVGWDEQRAALGGVSNRTDRWQNEGAEADLRQPRRPLGAGCVKTPYRNDNEQLCCRGAFRFQSFALL